MRAGRGIAIGLGGVLLVLQLVPYGRDHANPPVTLEAPWPNAEARRIAVHACYDCHSNRTNWRWYSHVAPVSWYVQHDVEEGRSTLNFSEWDRPQREARDMVETVLGGSMPPRAYALVHPSVKLSDSDKQILAAAMRELVAQGAGRGGRG